MKKVFLLLSVLLFSHFALGVNPPILTITGPSACSLGDSPQFTASGGDEPDSDCYSSDDTSVATVDQDSGVVTTCSAGTTTIWVTQDPDSNGDKESASAPLTVVAVADVTYDNKYVIQDNETTVTANSTSDTVGLQDPQWQVYTYSNTTTYILNELPSGMWFDDDMTTVTIPSDAPADGYYFVVYDGANGQAYSGTSGFVYVMPINIGVVSSLNPPGSGSNGDDCPLSSSSNACVGEPIYLEILGTDQLPNGLTITGTQWNVSSNGIETYNPYADASPVTQMDNGDYTESAIYFYYVIGTTESVSCTLTFSTGDTVTPSGSLNVVSPTTIVSGSMPGPVQVYQTTTAAGNPGRGVIIDGSNAQLPGMQVSCQGVNPPDGFTCGQVAWNQEIKDTIMAVTDGTYGALYSCSQANDHGFPYGNIDGFVPLLGSSSYPMSDSPSWGANNPGRTELDRTFKGNIYYMWCSDVPSSIWVPLYVYTWGFGGEMNWNGNEWVSGSQYLTNSPYTSSGAISSAQSEPNWTNTSTE